MDYEVFLLSRIRGEYLRTGDSDHAVVHGIGVTARTISAGAAIMVAVFAGFIAGNDPVVKMLGLGLATAVLVDATVVRLVLVPAAMKLLGRLNWWLPAWLDRLPTAGGTPGVRRRPHASGHGARLRRGRGRAAGPLRPGDSRRTTASQVVRREEQVDGGRPGVGAVPQPGAGAGVEVLGEARPLAQPPEPQVDLVRPARRSRTRAGRPRPAPWRRRSALASSPSSS